MAKRPKVKRYKATVEGFYAGKQYEASIVTYNKTKKQTKERLKEFIAEESPDPNDWLYSGYYKTRPDKGKKARVSITKMQEVDQEYRVIRRDVIKSYTRIVRGKKQTVKGYTREYREYYIPEDEEDFDELERGRATS